MYCQSMGLASTGKSELAVEGFPSSQAPGYRRILGTWDDPMPPASVYHLLKNYGVCRLLIRCRHSVCQLDVGSCVCACVRVSRVRVVRCVLSTWKDFKTPFVSFPSRVACKQWLFPALSNCLTIPSSRGSILGFHYLYSHNAS